MATATALAAPTSPRGPRTAPLRLAHPAAGSEVDLDLDRVADDAFAPHRVDEGPLAEVIALPTRRGAVRPRWGRIAVVVVALAAVFAMAMGTVADADGPAPIGATVTLEPGQTLWEIAVTATPDGQDPRATLAEIERLNGFTSGTIPAWTSVVLPAR